MPRPTRSPARFGNPEFHQSGAATLTVNGSGSYTGTTTIKAGTLQLGNTGALPSTSDVADTATLDLHGNSATIGALTGTGIVTTSVAGAVTLAVGATGDNGTFSGAIKNGSGVVSLSKVGSGAETLAGAQSFTGSTSIADGILTVNGSLYTSATPGTVALASAGVILNGSGTIHGGVDIESSSFLQETHVDGVTVMLPAIANRVGITVEPNASAAQIGVTKAVTVNGGSSTSTGILVYGSAMIVSSNISGHEIDVNVDGGSAVLQKDTLNAGTGSGIGWTGLKSKTSRSSMPANPPPTPHRSPPPTPPTTSASTATSPACSAARPSAPPPTAPAATFSTATLPAPPRSIRPHVAQAIRDLNTGAASFSALANGVETSVHLRRRLQLGRMDLTAQNDTFNGAVNPTSSVVKKFVFDGQRDAADGFVVYGQPTLTVTQSGVPKYVAPGNSYTINVNFANTGTCRASASSTNTCPPMKPPTSPSIRAGSAWATASTPTTSAC